MRPGMRPKAKGRPGARARANRPPGPSAGPRSPLRQRLERHLEALRAIQASYGRLRADNVALARVNRQLKDALERRLDLSVESPAFEGGLGGRTAVQQYANVNLGRFMEHINEVGVRARVAGKENAEFFLRTVVARDYACLLGARPLTIEEAKDRAWCEWALTPEGGVASLADPEDDDARIDFIATALRSCGATTTQELVRRSGEMPVARSVSRDDEDGD